MLYVSQAEILSPNQDSKKLSHIWPNLSAGHISTWHSLAVAKRWQCFCSAFSSALFPFLLSGLEVEKNILPDNITSAHIKVYKQSSTSIHVWANISFAVSISSWKKINLINFVTRPWVLAQFMLIWNPKRRWLSHLWCNPRIGHVIFTKNVWRADLFCS